MKQILTTFPDLTIVDLGDGQGEVIYPGEVIPESPIQIQRIVNYIQYIHLECICV